MAYEIELVGDVIQLDGEPVAVLSDVPNASTQGRFRDIVTYVMDTSETRRSFCCSDSLDEMVEKISPKAQAGLIRLSDLKSLLAKMKEDRE